MEYRGNDGVTQCWPNNTDNRKRAADNISIRVAKVEYLLPKLIFIQNFYNSSPDLSGNAIMQIWSAADLLS